MMGPETLARILASWGQLSREDARGLASLLLGLDDPRPTLAYQARAYAFTNPALSTASRELHRLIDAEEREASRGLPPGPWARAGKR